MCCGVTLSRMCRCCLGGLQAHLPLNLPMDICHDLGQAGRERHQCCAHTLAALHANKTAKLDVTHAERRLCVPVQARYERHHGCAFTPAALQAAVTLSSRYVADRFLPDKVRWW